MTATQTRRGPDHGDPRQERLRRIQELRRSSATTRHADRRQRRARTRTAALAASMKESQ